MNYFWEKNKYFFAIIAGAIIIGGFVYFGLQYKNNPSLRGASGASNEAISKSKSITPEIASSLEAPRNDENLKTSLQSQIKTNSVSPTPNPTTCGAPSNTIVTKVIDGDTVVVEGGWHVRLLGMDADEKGYPCYDVARVRLENLVLAKQVVLEKDVSDVDQYGRCLRYIFVGNVNVNADVQLVKEGLAVARFYSPDVKYRTEITAAETYAQQNKIGCKWNGALQTAK